MNGGNVKTSKRRNVETDVLSVERRARLPFAIRYSTFCILCAVAIANAQSGGDYTITKSTIDSGGGTVSGGDYVLTGTAGQPDAATLSGGDYSLSGGFWSPVAAAPAAFIPEPGGVHMNRFIGLVVPTESAGQQTAIRVTLSIMNRPRACCTDSTGTSCSATPCDVDSHCPSVPGGNQTCAHQALPGAPDYSAFAGKVRYVNSFNGPGGSLDCADDGPPFNTSYKCATLGCDPEYRDWAADLASPGAGQPQVPGLIYITGDALVPSTRVDVSHLAASCGAAASANACVAASAPLVIGTARWGDTSGAGFSPPDGIANVLDVPPVVNKLKGIPTGSSDPENPPTNPFPEYRLWLKQRDPAANVDAITVIDLSDEVDACGFAKPYPANRTIDVCPTD